MAVINIRSITMGINWEDQSQQGLSEEIKGFMGQAQYLFDKQGAAIRTCRMSMSPLNRFERFSRASSRSIVGWVSDLCQQVGIRWFCVPFSCLGKDDPRELACVAAEVVNRHKNAFVNLIVARDGVISTTGVNEASRLVRLVSRMSNNGFDNFRVGISCNCNPHTPFFPFSYHEGQHGFSLALETVDAFIDIVQRYRHDGVDAIRTVLLDVLTDSLREIDATGQEIEQRTGIRFLGIDASLAPFPNGDSSVARVIELLGIEDFGSNGSLFFTAYLTDVIKAALARSGVRRVGFNGVMYSLLEDDYLALRNKQKNLTLDGLLLYSAVCGCGIDMVPVPGDILEEEIGSLILDVAGLAIALDKPLGVRILPIQAKAANEITNFNYDFLVDTRVMEVRNRGYTRTFFKNDHISYLREKNR